MQTITLDNKSQRAPAHLAHAYPGSVQNLPVVPPQRLKTQPGKVQACPAQELGSSPNVELDAMLGNEPALGAVRGLRVALLFNAGLALSGLMAYELWSMIAR